MKKGFTLIELLAVIVILAIISLIAVPIVLDIIQDSRKSAAARSADGYVRTVNYTIANLILNDEVNVDGDYVIGENELTLNGDNLDKITGQYKVNNNRVIWAGLCVNNYSIEYSVTKGSSFATNMNYCSDNTFVFEEPDIELLREACLDDDVYTNTTDFKIKTVEDLVCLSQLTNNSKNFSGKHVYLVNDINIEDAKSYVNSTNTTYGDINEDNTTSGLLTELTTGKGFIPIKSFAGTFDGFAFTISNLMINRTSENNVGLFSDNSGNIKGIKLKGINIRGMGSVGGLVGLNSSGTISNIVVEGSILSINNSVGGIVGYYTNGTLTDSVVKATIQGNGVIGGIVGYKNGGSVVGLVYDTTLTATGSAPMIGKATAYNQPTNVMTSASTQLVYSGSRSSYSYDGTSYTTGSILVYDKVLDTIIGGDTDGDGYYFDINSTGNIELYSTAVTPIKTFKQSGTADSPYIIENLKDWKLATTTIESTPHYYSLASDLDFTNVEFYPMGTTANPFNGTFLGNHYTISNVSVNGFDNVGVFGYNTGTIRDLVFINPTIVGINNNVGLIGYNTGAVNGIKVRNANITNNGTNYLTGLGGIVGTGSGGTIKNVDVQGSILGNTSYIGRIGGIMGSGTSVITDAVFKGTVEGRDQVGGILGNNSGQAHKAVVYDSTISSPGSMVGKATTYNWAQNIYVSSSTILNHTGGRDWSYDGTAFTDITLEAVNNVIDTTIGGDNDEDGYYFTLTNGEYELIIAE